MPLNGADVERDERSWYELPPEPDKAGDTVRTIDTDSVGPVICGDKRYAPAPNAAGAFGVNAG